MRVWWNWQTRKISLMLPRCKNLIIKKSDSREPDLYKCRYGETGKHAGFRIQWSDPCRFKSCYLHHRVFITIVSYKRSFFIICHCTIVFSSRFHIISFAMSIYQRFISLKHLLFAINFLCSTLKSHISLNLQ